jgi:branched-chain amino acid transport system permease protein
VLVLIGIVAIVTALAGLGSGAQQRTATLMLTNIVLVVGLYIFVGNSGIVSFGHVTFMAIGAYVSGLLTIPLFIKSQQFENLPGFLADAELGTVPGTMLPALVAALIALVISIPIMRLAGLAASIATFALLLITNVVLAQAGSSTFIGLPLDTTLASGFVWVAVAIVLAAVFQNSAVGLRLKASREDEIAAHALGIDVHRERRIGFVLSAFVVGLGGALFGHLQGAFSPDTFFLQATFLMIVMLVVGGINSLAGAVIGTMVVSVILEGLRRVEEGVNLGVVDIPARPGLREVGLGILLLVILTLRPEGLFGGRELTWPLRRGKAGRRRRPFRASGVTTNDAG